MNTPDYEQLLADLSLPDFREWLSDLPDHKLGKILRQLKDYERAEAGEDLYNHLVAWLKDEAEATDPESHQSSGQSAGERQSEGEEGRG